MQASANGTNATYPPINTLKGVADDVWIVDGPVIRFGMPWPKFPFPTPMTVIRLTSGELFVHSPTPLTPELQSEIERIHIRVWRSPLPEKDVPSAGNIQDMTRGNEEMAP